MNVSGGVLQSPLLCWGLYPSIVGVSMDLSGVSVPDFLSSRADVCFRAPIILNDSVFPFNLTRNPFGFYEGIVHLYVVDFDFNSYSSPIIHDFGLRVS